MQILYALIILASGVMVGWFAARLLRRESMREDGRTRTAAADLDSLWSVDARALLDGLPLMILLVDAGDRVVYRNGLCARVLPMFSIGIDPATTSAPLAEIVHRARSGDDVGSLDTIIVGDPPLALRVTASATSKGILITLVDATEDVDFDEARRTFSAAVSHELRTPLARILGLAETLALPDVADERDELVQQIENEIDGMRRLIDEMLLLAALDRGRLAVADGIVDACEISARVVVDARQRRIGRGREITLSAPGQVDVPVSSRLFEVVVQNLVNNALIHGGPNARVDVTVGIVDDAAVISVNDTGTGISADHLPFVFQRFYRGDASRSGPGSGLGLALVKHIVEAHGGSVTARSDGRTGTTISVQLPIAD